jgi:two-component system sensor histidine kinase DesK
VSIEGGNPAVGGSPRRQWWRFVWAPRGSAAEAPCAHETAPPRKDGSWASRELAGKATPLIWLVFLIVPLLELSTRERSAVHLIVTIAACVVFAALFGVMVLLPDERVDNMSRSVLLSIVVAMWGLTIFLVFYSSPSWDYEFLFTVYPALHLLGRRVWTVLAIAVAALVVGATSGLDWGDIVVVDFLVFGVGVSAYGVSRLITANETLKAAQVDQARAAVAEERLRFARDLHDLLGHSLSVITLKTEVAGRILPTDPERAGQEIAEIQEVARRALREVREAVGGYRQATVEVELAGARTALAAASIRWQEDVAAVDLPCDVETALAWTIREGVTNVVRHSAAATCFLSLWTGAGEVVVTVADDGVGSGAAVTSEGALACGNGLIGLGERVAAVGGRIEAGPRTGGGFELRVTLPLSESPATESEGALETPADPLPAVAARRAAS